MPTRTSRRPNGAGPRCSTARRPKEWQAASPHSNLTSVRPFWGPVPVRAGSVGGSNFGTVSCKTCSGCAPGVFRHHPPRLFSHEYGPRHHCRPGGGEDASSAAARAALEANLGLDQPLPVRYVLWLKELLTGDLGLSYRTGQPVLGMIAQRVGPSLILTGTGVAAAVVIGIPLGVMAAWKPRSLWSRLAGGLTLLSFSAPGFFLCVLAIFFFSVVLGWLPAAGMYSAAGGGGLGDLLRHLVLPASVVCLSSLGNLVRQTASACGEVLGEDYIRTARAKGLPEWAVVWKHGFRTALLPVVTTILNHIPHIIGGSLVVERIFGWPGMGSLLFTSVSSRDYTVIMGLTVVIALSVLATGILMDLVYRLVDPGVGWGGEGR